MNAKLPFPVRADLNLVPQHPDLREECGVCGVFNHREAAHLVYLGLTALQHRGQESAGIVAFNGRMNRHVGMGLVFDVFKKENIHSLKGDYAVGHVRYSTTGSSVLKNAQPLLVTTPYGQIAVGHNGNITNAERLKKELESSGAIFQTTTDSEVLLHLIARTKERSLPDAIISALKKVQGAYSLLIASDTNSQGRKERCMIAVRDPMGFRPLILGKVGHSWVVASETCVFNLIGGQVVREIEPGEMLILEGNRPPQSRRIAPKSGRKSLCVFEYIYFSRPDSKVFGQSVYEVRRELGRQLAREAPAPHADCVIAVPDSAVVAAIGFSETSRLPYEIGFIRSHYVGRTFIEPSKPMRDFRAKVKYSPIRENLAGKKIVLIDDSIVRGNTTGPLIKLLKNAGAKEVHVAITCPPIAHPCFMGVDRYFV
jgi:amidophosphoribosyltransferase